MSAVIAEQDVASASHPETNESGCFRAEVARAPLDAALDAASHVGNHRDDQGNKAEAFVMLIPEPERQRVLLRAAGSGAAITASVPAEQIEGESVTIEAQRFFDLVGIAEAGSVTLKSVGERFHVKTQSGHFKLRTRTMGITEPQAAVDNAAFMLPASTIRDAIRRCSHAMAKDDARHYLNGMCLQVRRGEMRVVASDARRLAYERIPLPGVSLPENECILSTDTVKAFSRLLSGREEDIRVRVSPKAFWASVPSEGVLPAAQFVSPVLEGVFVDYEKVIPDRTGSHVLSGEYAEIRRGVEYAEAINQQQLFDSRGAVIASTSAGQTSISSGENAEGRVQLDLCRTSPNGDEDRDIRVGVNSGFLHQAFQAIPASGEVALELCNQKSDGPRSLIITSHEAPWFMEIIMGMTLHV